MVRRMALAAAVLAGAAWIGPVAAQDAAADAARLRQMMECDAIKSETIRLSCYDSAARRNRTSMGAGSVGMLPGRPAAQPATPQQLFGMTAKIQKQQPTGAVPQPVEEITARIAGAHNNGVGLWQFAFVDGTRWQSTEMVQNLVPPRQGQEVRIRKGAMGGYLMYMGGKQPSFRVQRLK